MEAENALSQDRVPRPYLNTVRDYFDHVFLINTRKVAEGPVDEAFTIDNLQAAYGGRLAAAHVEQLSGTLG